MRALAPESPFDVTRRGFAVGTAVLDAVRPASAGPTDVVPGEAQLATLKVYLFGKMAGVIMPISLRPTRLEQCALAGVLADVDDRRPQHFGQRGVAPR